jgi:hypothetical protein
MSNQIPRKQLATALVTAGLFFGYLAVATLFHDVEVVRLLLIRPYGLSAGVWLALALAILGRRARREQDRLR